MIRAVVGLWASGQRVIPAGLDTGKVEQNSLMAILSIPTIHPIGDRPMHGLIVVSIQWHLIGMVGWRWVCLT